MGQPTWRKIATVTVPARKATIWTPALDFVTQDRLYRITVETKPDPADPAKQVDQTWLPESGTRCTADGDPAMTRKEALTIDGCPAGALIAKVGGSSADLKPGKDSTLLFAVGRHCVFSISDAGKCGGLYFGINDAQASMARIEGELEVTVCEGL
jgi:hypothetical protein